jgi:hypothetical protein
MKLHLCFHFPELVSVIAATILYHHASATILYHTIMCLQVNFGEPLSFLQRLTEDFEYSDCLDKAARCEDSCEQLAYVAAFTASSYATTNNRTGKPFNPLLGETYEFDRRDDYGWRSFCEQVRWNEGTHDL